MKNYQLHNDCKILSAAEYKNSKVQVPKEWVRIKTKSNAFTGFRAGIYKNGNTVAIVFRGTDDAIDLVESDLNMLQKCIPNQIPDARRFYKEVREAYPNCKIVLTGHSLGGSNAQVIGSETGADTVTFAAYGTGNLYGTRAVYSDNITNYGNSHDSIYISNIDNQVGKTILLNSNANQDEVLIKSEPRGLDFKLKPHFLENFGDLSKGVEYKKDEFDSTPLFKTGVEYVNYDDSVFDLKNRVLYGGEILIKDMDNDMQNHFLDQVFENKKLPTKEELDKRTRIGELIYVDEYVRSDGTKVSGYYRAYPR